jgi:hypothetical protein
VSFLGASTPADRLRRFLAQVSTIEVAISCLVPVFLGGALRSVQAVHAAQVPVLVGGRAFGPDDLRAVGWAPTAGRRMPPQLTYWPAGARTRQRWGTGSSACATPSRWSLRPRVLSWSRPR